MTEEEKFEIRAYGKAELAYLYNPAMPLVSAMRKLRSWILRNEDLHRAMYQAGEGKNDHTYTRRQVRLMVQHLGEP